MKYYKCDNCEKEVPHKDAPVVLSGVTGTSGGILLPEFFCEKHFCSPTCFWEWIRRYDPSN